MARKARCSTLEDIPGLAQQRILDKIGPRACGIMQCVSRDGVLPAPAVVDYLRTHLKQLDALPPAFISDDWTPGQWAMHAHIAATLTDCCGASADIRAFATRAVRQPHDPQNLVSLDLAIRSAHRINAWIVAEEIEAHAAAWARAQSLDLSALLLTSATTCVASVEWSTDLQHLRLSTGVWPKLAIWTVRAMLDAAPQLRSFELVPQKNYVPLMDFNVKCDVRACCQDLALALPQLPMLQHLRLDFSASHHIVDDATRQVLQDAVAAHPSLQDVHITWPFQNV